MNNKFIKRFGKVILNAVILLGFMACRNNSSAVNNKKPEKNENEKKDKGKVLVVYYSQTGTTEGVAKIIARETNADLVKLEVKNEYTSDDLNWTDKNSRVNREHDNPNSRNVELKNAVIPNFASYDTVFIGYPIWWREALWLWMILLRKMILLEKL